MTGTVVKGHLEFNEILNLIFGLVQRCWRWWARMEHQGELLADFESCLGIPAIDNGEPEAARRHRVHLRRSIVVKGYLNTGDTLPA